MRNIILSMAVVVMVTGAVSATIYHFEAEDCTLVNNTAEWFVYNPGWSSGNVAAYAAQGGNVQFGTGYTTLRIPDALPDGEYTLKIRWNFVNAESGAGGFYSQYNYLIYNYSGTLVENGATAGAWHTFYPGYYPNTGSGVREEYLSGPAMATLIAPSNPQSTSLNISGVAAGDIALFFMDDNAGSYVYSEIDWVEFELIPEPCSLMLLGAGGLLMLRRKHI